MFKKTILDFSADVCLKVTKANRGKRSVIPRIETGINDTEFIKSIKNYHLQN